MMDLVLVGWFVGVGIGVSVSADAGTVQPRSAVVNRWVRNCWYRTFETAIFGREEHSQRAVPETLGW
jgi:hypothetical protein